jgi:hypothetical protein
MFIGKCIGYNVRNYSKLSNEKKVRVLNIGNLSIYLFNISDKKDS